MHYNVLYSYKYILVNFVQSINFHWSSSMHAFIGLSEGMPHGIPNTLQLQDDRTKKINATLVPTPSHAAGTYKSNGGVVSFPLFSTIVPSGRVCTRGHV